MAAATPQEVTSAYLTKNNVQQVLQEAVNKMLSVQPRDPALYLSDQLRDASAAINPPKPTVVFVLGGPGSGKGTQCAKIVKHFDFVHLSAGDLLRAERQSGSADAELINNYIQQGKIVPVEITVNLLKKAIQSASAIGRTHFLVDGFPRNQDNLDGWEKAMAGECEVPFVLSTDLSEAVMEQRLLGRNEGRSDDNIETIRKRFKVFNDETMPVLKTFEEKGRLRRVDASASVQRVFENVCDIFAEFHMQTTYAFIKPDAFPQASKILNHIREAGFEILAKTTLTLTDQQASTFYAEHASKPFFPGMKQFMTSGPCIALALRARNAQKLWRKVLGPTDSDKARQQAPGSIRALYGTNGQKNACHGSDSLSSANRELNLMFPNNSFTNKLGPRIIIAGGPACGKGTQSELIVKRFGVVHISTGDMLRDAVKAGTELGLQAKEKMESGQLVSDDLIIGITKQKLETFAAVKLGFLLDGFPRTGVQAQAMIDNGINADFFLLVDVPDEELVTRVSGRRLDPVTNKIYHLKYNPPPKDIEGRLTQRADDTEAKIRVRIGDFRKNIDAISGFFKNIRSDVNGVGKPPSEVFESIGDIINKSGNY